jgi:phosphoglycolate phosphatase-like HAD superfamily hydrolase
MEKLKACIWDLDGTLLDSYDSIVSSLVEVAGQCGSADPPDLIMKAVKQGSVSAYLKGLSAVTGKDTGTLYEMYRTVSHERMDEITLVPGAAETLQALKEQGVKHFVYTHRGKSTLPLLDRLGLTAFFTEIVTFESGFRPKPSGEGVAYLLGKYRLKKPETAYVGDRTLDVLCAKDAGVLAVLYLPEDSCVIPTGKEDLIIRKLEELIPYLKGL